MRAGAAGAATAGMTTANPAPGGAAPAPAGLAAAPPPPWAAIFWHSQLDPMVALVSPALVRRLAFRGMYHDPIVCGVSSCAAGSGHLRDAIVTDNA